MLILLISIVFILFPFSKANSAGDLPGKSGAFPVQRPLAG